MKKIALATAAVLALAEHRGLRTVRPVRAKPHRRSLRRGKCCTALYGGRGAAWCRPLLRGSATESDYPPRVCARALEPCAVGLLARQLLLSRPTRNNRRAGSRWSNVAVVQRILTLENARTLRTACAAASSAIEGKVPRPPGGLELFFQASAFCSRRLRQRRHCGQSTSRITRLISSIASTPCGLARSAPVAMKKLATLDRRVEAFDAGGVGARGDEKIRIAAASSAALIWPASARPGSSACPADSRSVSERPDR